MRNFLREKIEQIYKNVELQNWTSATQLLEEIDRLKNELNSIQLQLSNSQNPLWQEELREYEHQLKEGIIDEDWLSKIEYQDNIFPDIDYHWFKGI